MKKKENKNNEEDTKNKNDDLKNIDINLENDNSINNIILVQTIPSIKITKMKKKL